MHNKALSLDELEFLDSMLQQYSNEDSMLCVSELDGFLTALVCSPDELKPDRWFPAIWGGPGNEPVWDSEVEFRRFMSLLMQHMANISTTLRDYPDLFEALFLEGEVEGRICIIVDEWCVGFLTGVELCPDRWATMPEALIQDCLVPISMFALDEYDEQLALLSEQTIEGFIGKIEPGICAMYSYWLDNRSPAPPAAPPESQTECEIGREDLCTCGSGKAYKKCCLH